MTSTAKAACDQCGWTKTYASQAYATDRLRRHSCEKHLAKVASAERARQREASVDRTPKPCHHKQANHQHGTLACYVLDQCRCRPCTAACTAYERHRTRQNAYGRAPFVDATPAREHIQSLSDRGMGWKRVAAAAGLSASTVWKVMYGPPNRGPAKRVRQGTADAILAVRPDLANGAQVPSVGTRRRLQALVAIGWSQTRLADRLGSTLGNLNKTIHGKQGGVTVATEAKARALYDELWNQVPPASNRYEAAGITRAKNVATEHGWPPPMAWDDDTIDDPTATPDTGTLAPKNGPGRPAEHIADDVEWFLTLEPLALPEHVAHRLGIHKDTMQTALRRAGRDDLRDQLVRNVGLDRGDGIVTASQARRIIKPRPASTVPVITDADLQESA